MLTTKSGASHFARRISRTRRAAADRGELVLGGAFASPVDGAVILFRGDSPAAAEQFAKNDPYVVNGVVRRWYVRQWTTVVGKRPLKSRI